MKIKCFDNIYKLNYCPLISIAYPKVKGGTDRIKLIDFVTEILQGTGISLITDQIQKGNPLFDMTLYNISFINMTPAAILEHLKKELGFNISLNKDKLYLNIASNTVDTVKLDTRQNVKFCDLQPNRTTQGGKNKSLFQRIKVKAWFYNETNGKKESVEVGDENGQNRDVFFYRIDVRGKSDSQKEAIYKKLANEALLKFRQRRFNGSVKTYLYPECDLFWRCEYTDFSYPERNGVYAITAIKTTLSENGFERELKLAYIGELI